MPDRDPVDVRWHQTVLGLSALVPFGLLLPEGNPIRQLLAFAFVVFVPGMAIAGQSSVLRARGLLSFETWTVIFPLSFIVGVAGSLFMAYLEFWHPGLLVCAMALGTGLLAFRRLQFLAGKGPHAETTAGSAP